MTCLPGGERATAGFQELPPDAVMAPGAVDWFDQRKVIPASDARFVDSRRLVEVRQGREEVTRHLVWADYRSELTARRIAGNDLFQRLEINRGLIEGVEDRRILSAVQVQASETGQLHIVTCVDDGIFYRGVLMPDEDVITLHKLAEGNSPTAQVMTEAEELKFLFNGCWDANLHIRERGMTVVQEHLRQIEADLAIRGPDISPLMSRRFRLTTTPAQAVLFAKYPRRTFATHTRQFATSEYTFPLTDTTPPAVRSSIATHLNTLTGVPGGFNAANVLDPSAIANIPPKGKNIAFLALTYTDGRPPEVFYSASGAARNKTDLALGRRLAKEGIDSTAPWTGAEGTRYINCRGEGAEAAADSLLHLPDLSQPGSLSTRQRNDRRLDAERNILARLERGGIQGDEVAEAYLFTRFPTCQSCTTLIAQYREQFPAGRFSVYEGPLPARVNVEPGAPTQ